MYVCPNPQVLTLHYQVARQLASNSYYFELCTIFLPQIQIWVNQRDIGYFEVLLAVKIVTRRLYDITSMTHSALN